MNNLMKIVGVVTAGFVSSCSNTIDNIIVNMVPHPQEPTERSYKVREVQFLNPGDGTRIAGELTYPASGESFPALVLISGTAANEPPFGRNAEITGHKYFLVISDMLTKLGYAVLRFDNRGTGSSSGDYLNATDQDFASDAAAALKWLREDSGLQISSSGYLGHSQGSVKATLATKLEKADFMIFLAGGVETIAKTILRQNAALNKVRGVEQSVIDQHSKELADLLNILRTSGNREEAERRIRNYTVNAGITDERHIQSVVNEYASTWMYVEAHRNPAPLIHDYEGPILALFGSKDLLVSSAENASLIRKELVNPNSEVYIFDGLNHLFQTADKGGPDEYWQISNTINEIVIEKIDNWVQSILKTNHLYNGTAVSEIE